MTMERANKKGVPLRAMFALLAVAGVIGFTVPFAAADSPVRTVKGEVVAVNVSDSPPVIVVKAMTAKKQQLIVGTVVEPNTVITRGGKKVTLDSIKPGESAVLTYVKNEDGLVARSIHVR